MHLFYKTKFDVVIYMNLHMLSVLSCVATRASHPRVQGICEQCIF